MNADWGSLYKSGNDFELVDRLFCAVADKKEREGAASLNEAQGTLLLAWHAHGVIGNGSLTAFFESGLPVEATAAAFERVGFSRAAQLLRLAPDLLPVGDANSECSKRLTQIDELSTAFWKASDGFDSAMAEFVQANKEAFDELMV